MDLNKIKEGIINLPNQIYNQQNKVNEALDRYEKEKANTKVTESINLIQADANNATEKKAISIKNSEKCYIDEIKYKGLYEAEKAKLELLLRRFDAFKKVANLEDAQIRTNIHKYD